MKHDFVKNHEHLVLFFKSISYIAGTCGRPCVTHFTTMSIFRRIQVFSRLGVLAPLSVCVGSHPPEISIGISGGFKKVIAVRRKR